MKMQKADVIREFEDVKKSISINMDVLQRASDDYLKLKNTEPSNMQDHYSHMHDMCIQKLEAFKDSIKLIDVKIKALKGKRS